MNVIEEEEGEDGSPSFVQGSDSISSDPDPAIGDEGSNYANESRTKSGKLSGGKTGSELQ